MRKIGRLKVYSVLFLALIINVTVIDRFRIFGIRPDTMIICVTFFGFFFGRSTGLESGMVAGILTDIFSLDYFGANIFVYASSGLLAGSLKTSFAKESRRTQALIVLLCALFSMSLHFFIASSFSRSIGFGFSEYLRIRVLPVSLYTAALSVPVFMEFMNIFDIREEDDLL